MRKCMSAIVMALLVLTGVASAQETTGTLSGRLVDTQGLAVPGATVTVTGPQGARSFVTDENGRFSAPFLTPGVYDVRAELQGFKAVQVDDVTVSLGQTSEISLRMEVGGLTETVQVVGSTAIVDTTSTTVGATITSEMLARVPVGRRFSDTLYLAPGVSSSGSAGRANPSMSGGTGLDNQYVVDGVNVTNQGYGALGSYSIVFGSLGNATPFDFIKEVQVKTGGYEAEFGQSMGGVVNVVTKSGSNNVRGSVFGYTQPGALEGEYKTFQSINGTVNTVGQARSDVGLEIGGPIIQNRMFFFGALNPSWETRTFIAPTDAEHFPAAALGEIDRERRTLSYSGKTTFQINAQNRIDASFFGDPSKGPMGPQRTSALLGPVLASGQLEQYSELTKFGGHNQTVRYDGVVSPTWLVEASFARAVNDIEEVPLVDEWRYRDFTVTPTRITGGIGFFEAGNHSLNNQWSIKSTHILRGHEVKYGFAFDDVEYSQLNQRTGPTFTTSDGRQTATGAQVDVISDPAFGRIYRVIRANYTEARDTEQTYWNFFVQDQWRASSRLTVNAGLRYEQESLIGTFSELHTLDGQTLDAFDLKGNWAPRIGFVYDVLGNGRSKLFGNWGRFFARLPNDIAARALSADEGVSRADYFDAALTQPIPNGVLAGGVTEHLALAGAHPSLIDPDAKLSYKDEFAAGFEWEAFPNTNVGIRYVHRNIGRAIEDVAAAPLAAYDLGLPGAESTEYILTNPDEDFPTAFPELGARFEKPVHNYDAVELTVDRRFSNNWSLMGSYRWSRLFGTYEGFFREDNGQSDPGLTSLYDFPTNDPSYTQIGVPQFGYRGDIRYLGELGEGPLPLDRPHQFKLFGNYSMDNGLGIGLGLTASSGKPLTALAGNSWYGNGGEIPETPRGEGFETVDGFRKRTPMEFQVDMQASYNVRLFGERRLTLLADAFNLFNLRRTIDYNTYTELIFGEPNPDFGTPTSQNVSGQMFQNPFQLRLGARFEW